MMLAFLTFMKFSRILIKIRLKIFYTRLFWSERLEIVSKTDANHIFNFANGEFAQRKVVIEQFCRKVV